MRVLILNGAPRSGKDTFITYATVAYPGRVISYSAIDHIKSVARERLSWDGAKDRRGRRLLSDLKAAATRYNDLPFKMITGRAVVHGLYIIVAREPAEIGKLRAYYDGRGIWCRTVIICRESAEKAAMSLDNPADLGYAAYDYDHMVENNSGLTALWFQVDAFVVGLDTP